MTPEIYGRLSENLIRVVLERSIKAMVLGQITGESPALRRGAEVIRFALREQRALDAARAFGKVVNHG